MAKSKPIRNAKAVAKSNLLGEGKMSNDKLTRWIDPSPVELDIWRNSISSELSNDNTTYTPVTGQEIIDIVSEGREVIVKGLTLTRSQRLTILDALAFASETEGCNIPLAELDEVRRALVDAR